MKLTAIILLAACLTASAEGMTQQVNIRVKNASLESVFKELKKQTGYQFLYNNQMLDKAKKVTIDIRNGSLEDVLNICFKEQGLTYEIIEKTIVVKPKEGEVPNETLAASNEPPIDVKGRVVNEAGEPVEGASVMVKGTKIGTTTNANGEFQLSGIDEDAVLVISGVSIETQEIAIAKNPGLKTGEGMVIRAVTEVTTLNEVVINKGYYSEKQKFSVGNVSKIGSKDIEKQPLNNPILALQGRVPGLLVTQANGIPGGGVTVRIQGQNSIRAGNDPLYIIDGVPYPSQMLVTNSAGGILGNSSASIYSPGGSGNPLSYINPADIESIEVLKDADATSIYGSRAANGAILITTKSGKPGPTRIDVDLRQGWGRTTRSMDLMNSQQYLEMRKEALANDGIVVTNTDANYDVNGLWDQHQNTDWVKVLSGGTAKFTTGNLSVSGGSLNIQYLVRGAYQRETTVFSGDYSDQKGSIHSSLNTKSYNGKFRLQFSATYLTDNNELPRNDYTFQAYLLPPNAPSLYKEDGTLNWAPNLVGNSSWTNPLSGLYQNYQNKTDNLVSSTVMSYALIPGLELSTRLGYTKLSTREVAPTLSLSQRPENRLPDGNATAAIYTNSEMRALIVEPQLTYKRKLLKGNLEMLLGATIQKNNNNGSSFSGRGYATDALATDIRSAKTLTVNSTVDAIYKYNAAFIRLNYNLKDKYILNMTARRDGSSRFGPENRFHNFASTGAAWVFSEENFFRSNFKFLSFGKLRGSYGTTGNDQIGDYLFMDLYSSTSTPLPYHSGSSLSTNRIPNPYLQWEETNKLSFGLDLGFLQDRILMGAGYSRNRSSNQLLPYSLPIIAGFAQIDRNFPAMVQNESWEFVINTKNLRRKTVEWNTSFNLTVPRNKLLKFPGLEKSSYARDLFIGQPLSIVQAYRFMGVDPATGVYQFLTHNGTLSSNPSLNDRTVLVNIDPKFYGGLQNSVRVKNFEIDIFFQGTKQTQQNSMQFGKSVVPGSFGGNQPVSLLNRWQKPGDIALVQKFGTSGTLSNAFGKANLSDAAYVNVSYMRLENMAIAYQFSGQFLKKFHLRSCRLYIQGQNLLTLTSFGGIDPENRSFNSLAPLKIYACGIQAGF